MANEERPTITWKRDEPQRPTIQRPAPERPTIERPTIDIQRPTIQRPAPERPTIALNSTERPAPERPTIKLGDTPAASPAQRPAPTPTPGKPDTGSHPGRQVSRLAHVLTNHYNNYKQRKTGNRPFTEIGVQAQIDRHRASRHKVGYDEGTQNVHNQLADSFINRHNKDYAFEDLID